MVQLLVLRKRFKAAQYGPGFFIQILYTSAAGIMSELND
jgi:hypothetical protein